MDTQQFKYFLQLCVDKNYAIAADRLYITQQALRKSIKRLELETGGPLFYRASDSLELTKAGICVKAHARNIIDELSLMEKSLEKLNSDHEQGIILASSYGVYPVIADNLIMHFKTRYPHIGLKIIELTDEQCEDAIKNDDVDLGFCIGPNNTEYFDVYEMQVHSVCAMVNKTNPLSKREYLTLQDLEGESLSIVGDSFKLHTNFLRACEREDVQPTIALNGGDVISVQNFSRFDKNIAITVDFLARDMKFDESVYVPIRADGLDWTVNMLINKSTPPSDATRLLESLVKEVFVK